MNIARSNTRYYVGTSFPSIGSPEYPMFHDNLESALETARVAHQKGYDATIYLQTIVELEEKLLTLTKK